MDRLKEAECMLAVGHYDGAYYIGGYPTELALKVIACKKLDVEIFDKTVVPENIDKTDTEKQMLFCRAFQNLIPFPHLNEPGFL